jgi:hypothetical protein
LTRTLDVHWNGPDDMARRLLRQLLHGAFQVNDAAEVDFGRLVVQ